MHWNWIVRSVINKYLIINNLIYLSRNHSFSSTGPPTKRFSCASFPLFVTSSAIQIENCLQMIPLQSIVIHLLLLYNIFQMNESHLHSILLLNTPRVLYCYFYLRPQNSCFALSNSVQVVYRMLFTPQIIHFFHPFDFHH